MAIKAGQIITNGDVTLLHRLQTAGPGQVSTNETTIYELGNYRSVGKVLDIPDLSFTLESIDAAPAMEALFVGRDYAADADGQVYDLATVRPFDVAGQFKPGKDAPAPYDAIASASAPYLMPESISYRFGLTDNAGQTATLRGDAIFYSPGAAFVQKAAGTAAAGQTVALDHAAYAYNGDVVGGTRYTLGVSLASGKRLRYGVDYTETVTGTGPSRTVAVVVADPVAATDAIRILYTSPTHAVYPQASHIPDAPNRPAAVRGRHLKLYVNDVAWTDVQSATVDWRVTLDRDQEFGNDQDVARDFDVPEVSGMVTVKPRDVDTLTAKLRAITGLAADPAEAGRALQRTPLELRLEVYSPTGGSLLKTLVVPDARIAVKSPGRRAQATWTIDFSSDGGDLKVYKGAFPRS